MCGTWATGLRGGQVTVPIAMHSSTRVSRRSMTCAPSSRYSRMASCGHAFRTTSAALARLIDDSPTILQVDGAHVTEVETGAAAVHAIPDLDAQAGQAQHRVAEFMGAAAQVLAHRTAAIAAEAYRQHPVVVDAQQLGVVGRMDDHRHEALSHRPPRVGQRLLRSQAAAQFGVDLPCGVPQEEAAEVAWVGMAALQRGGRGIGSASHAGWRAPPALPAQPGAAQRSPCR